MKQPPNPMEQSPSWEATICFLVLVFWHNVWVEFTDNILELTVGPIFTGHTQAAISSAGHKILYILYNTKVH
jgi:hypothetical protein